MEKNNTKPYIFVLIFSMFLSCVTERKRQKICKTCTLQEHVTDSIFVTRESAMVYVHDTLRYETENPCAQLCDSAGNLRDFLLQLKSDRGTKVELYTGRGPNGNQVLHINDHIDSLQAQVPVKTITRKTIQQVPARCDQPHLTQWDSFLIISGKLAWASVLITILYFGVKKVLK